MQDAHPWSDKPFILRPSKIATYTFLLREIAKTQTLIDKKFNKQISALRMKIYGKKITPEKFWAEYKKMLIGSVGKNNKKVQDLIAKTEKEMKKIKKQEPEKTKEPMIDLKLPE